MNERAAQKAGQAYKVITEEFKNNDRAQAEGQGRGLLKMLLGERGKVLGVQILGPSAGELLGEWAAVLGGGVKLTALASAMHPYPTLAEINKRAASSYLAPKLFSGAVPKALKMVFGLKGRACG
jgi:pyruvate/2-oxoglutarate dehydrogenase complex dihydrolipoamide dehydrogenase (E3) component